MFTMQGLGIAKCRKHAEVFGWKAETQEEREANDRRARSQRLQLQASFVWSNEPRYLASEEQQGGRNVESTAKGHLHPIFARDYCRMTLSDMIQPHGFEISNQEESEGG